MNYSISEVNAMNASDVAELLGGYYKERWNGSTEGLTAGLDGRRLSLAVARTGDGRAAGFIAWTLTYDLNWCMPGGELLDIYVAPEHRGRGAALMLIIHAAAQLHDSGNKFLKGRTGTPVLRKTAKRFAAAEPDGELYLSGRALRHAALLAGKGLRKAVADLPEPMWNREP